ncbi:MAG: amidohydrolase family protein [Asgard group archaeon]|nr:amidohydrolase family protein [Asgard group archaeon]
MRIILKDKVKKTIESLLIKNINVFDVDGSAFRKNIDVLIENGIIKKVDKSIDEEGCETIIDGSGKYAIPGLFECHGHLAVLTTEDDKKKHDLLKKFVTTGFTQVRDVGGPVKILKQMKEDIDQGKLVGPEIFYSGPMLEKSPLAHGAHNEKMPEFTVAIDTKEAAEKMIKKLVNYGAKLVKTFNKFDTDVFKHLFNEARKENLPIAHDPGTPLFHQMPIDKAIDIGVNCFEHGKTPLPVVLKEELQKEHDILLAEPDPQKMMMFMGKIFKLGEDAISTEKLEKLIDKMLENDVYFCPTMAFKASTEMHKPERIADEQTKIAVQFIYDIGIYFTREIIKRNVKILIGQDGFDPHFTFMEMKILNEIGLSEAEAIKGATIYPARWLGVEKEYGSIESNKIANILILEKNPLDDIQNITSTNLVIYKGEIVR